MLVQVFFGFHYLAAKLLMREMPPRTYAVVRVAAAAAVLLLVSRLLARPFPSWRDGAWLALYSIFGVVINQVCFVEGLHRTTPTHSALLNTTIPIATLLFAALLGRERWSARKAVATAVALSGVLLLVHPERARWGSSTLTGDLLTLVNASSYALFLVISKRVFSRTDALAATGVLMGWGALGILAIGLPDLLRFRPAELDRGDWLLMAFVVVFATVGAYLLNSWALARADSSVVALFIYLQPLLAAGLSIGWLGEEPGWDTIAGGLLIFAGVFVAVRPGRARPRG